MALSVALFSYFELVQTREDLIGMSKSEADNLINALKHSIENNILSNEIIKDEIVNSLVSSASLADHTNTHERFTKKNIMDYCEVYDLDFLFLLDNKGIISNIDINSLNDLSEQLNGYLQYISEEQYFWLDLGVHEINSELYYLVGGEFTDKKTLVLSGIKESKLLDLRKSIGIGRLINDFGKNDDIVFVILQDTLGIIAATRNVTNTNDVNEDIEIASLTNEKPFLSRITDYNDKKILESVIRIENDEYDLYLRLGLSLEKVRVINQRNTTRTILLALGIFIVAVGITYYSYQRASHIKLKEEHRQILDYTGILLSNINEAVIGIDKDQMIILYNHKAEEFFGLVELNTKFSEHFNTGFLKLIEAMLTGKSFKYEEIEILIGNSKSVLAFSTSVVLDENNEPYVALAVLRDITEIRLNEEIKNRNSKLDAVSTLAAGVAHEVRNPMNAINIIAQRLSMEFIPNDDVQEYNSLIATVRSEIKRIDKIITQFLEFSKNSVTNLQKGNIVEPIRKAITLLKASIYDKDIELVDGLHPLIICNFDFDKIEQIFINLIQNAIDACEKGGIVQVESIENENSWMFLVKDNGSGISEDIKPRIFDIYFTTKSKGTGLGLGIVNKIVEEHKGKIHFDSSKIGTTFYIQLDKS